MTEKPLARTNGTEVANALTDAKARTVHPKICSPPMPAEQPMRILDIANAIVSSESAEKAHGIIAKYGAAQAHEA
jgi:hypothetical protein